MKNRKRIENRSSKTAAYTCMCRASSYLEKSPYFMSGDNISVQLLPKFIKFLIKLHILNLKGKISPVGIYQYVIARTKFIDDIFEEAVGNGFKQILILGAGFDSRAIRFVSSKNEIKVFEIDSYHTQKAKSQQLNKRTIHIPKNNIYIPMDFEKEDLTTKIKESCFNPIEKTLYILEGLTMYLSQDTIDYIFHFIDSSSAPGSLIVFDYIHESVLKRKGKYYGESAIYRRVKKDNEQWTFGIISDEIKNFLIKHHLNLIEHLDSNDMENKYFKNEFGNFLTRINGTHCLVLAQKSENT